MYNANVLTGNLLGKENKLFLKYLIKTGGPEQHDYNKLFTIVNNLDPVCFNELRETIRPILEINTLIGHAYKKPYGYPGDFSLIDRIYSVHINEDERYRKWDLLFQNQPAAFTVRNRKEYFLNYCKKLIEQNNRTIKVLILGSGPGTDVCEFLNTYPDSNISFDLIDFDQCAIDFSIRKNERFKKINSYNRINVLRFKPYKMYDLVWSAGLFDYFKDKHFIYLLRKYMNCLEEDGEFVISNFSTHNPTRRLMEVMSEWYLNYRTKSDLFHIAKGAGIDDEMVNVDAEPLGINLFLKIHMVKK
jgi:extracellular factor (EF) 3-hydroxypalmitic acid methyl ester biosynthesis protein